VEEDEAKTIAAINVGHMNNGADDPDTYKVLMNSLREV
jgi:hypothetical protein